MQHASNAFDAGLSGAADATRAPERDMVEVARYLVPMEANLVCGCLVAAGIPAVLADANLVQTDLLLAPALGGVRILVPDDCLAQAQAALDAFQRGEFALDEDADVSGA
ncbi:DUF2007 domain-containing protein [Massilia forsythiae]|uniref:DUF2007 domain-containing protein n=1 Tax=Massilia forsythiae TaxID=2728020 RepID=A0A7Z2VWT0_9BURK|nr:DUF2007 domain-containing protein [Massilia forsythiae]QJE00634.1 DUF2007 domain-containing protein [Massilia forsythiae]